MILSSIDINKGKQKLLFSVSFILFIVLCVFVYSEHDLENSIPYTCEKDDEEYVVSLYDKNGRKIEEIVFPKKPNIKELGKGLIEIEVVLGNPASYIFYFNQKTLQISNTFFNSVQMEGKYVAYIDGSRLIVQDIFSEDILYEEIIRDFSAAANPLMDIELIEKGNKEFIHFQYVGGNDYQIMEELLEIYPDK